MTKAAENQEVFFPEKNLLQKKIRRLKTIIKAIIIGECALLTLGILLFQDYREKEKMFWKAIDEKHVAIDDFRKFSSLDYVRMIYEYADLYEKHRVSGRLEYSIWDKDGVVSYITNLPGG